jgi:predicted RNase H-like nuclease (RuvC/YqgF family)
LDALRSQNATLLEENHRYARDIDRLHRENSDLRDQVSEHVERADRSIVDLQRILDEKSRSIDKLTSELTQRQAECQRHSRQVRDGEAMMRELFHFKEAYERCEGEREQFRVKIDTLEGRVGELSDLLNMELQKGYELE